jgi:hypothetical protein
LFLDWLIFLVTLVMKQLKKRIFKIVAQKMNKLWFFGQFIWFLKSFFFCTRSCFSCLAGFEKKYPLLTSIEGANYGHTGNDRKWLPKFIYWGIFQMLKNNSFLVVNFLFWNCHIKALDKGDLVLIIFGHILRREIQKVTFRTG